MIRKVNEDEYEYLVDLERELHEKEKQRWLQDQEEVQRFRDQVKQFEEQQQEEEEKTAASDSVDPPSRAIGKEEAPAMPKDLQKTILLSKKIRIKPKSVERQEHIQRDEASLPKKGLVDYGESDEEYS
jgi:hypothetical protein